MDDTAVILDDEAVQCVENALDVVICVRPARRPKDIPQSSLFLFPAINTVM